MSLSGRILIVDDDVRAAEVLAEVLAHDGFEVECADRGEKALDLLDARRFDAAVLDWDMPGMDGREVCRRIRARADDRAHMGVVMLTGVRVEDRDEVDVLGLGADDYMRKGKVSGAVFTQRLRTVIQRRRAMAAAMTAARGAGAQAGAAPELLFYGPLELNLDTLSVRNDGKVVTLTPRQFALLALLVKNAGQLVPHERLIAELGAGVEPAHENPRAALEWKIGQIKIIDEEMGHIRAALGDVGKKRIVAMRGMGYFLSRNQNE